MIRPPLAGVLLDAETGSRIQLHFHSDVWSAALEWLRFHGVDPNRIPAGTTVVVDRAARQIRYQALLDRPELVVVPAVEQGEGLAPYPPEILELLSEGAA